MDESLKEAINEAIKAIYNAYEIAVNNKCRDYLIKEISTAYNIMYGISE